MNFKEIGILVNKDYLKSFIYKLATVFSLTDFAPVIALLNGAELSDYHLEIESENQVGKYSIITVFNTVDYSLKSAIWDFTWATGSNHFLRIYGDRRFTVSIGTDESEMFYDFVKSSLEDVEN